MITGVDVEQVTTDEGGSVTGVALVANVDGAVALGLRVAVQEYGKPNPELIEGLEGRGAIVTRPPHTFRQARVCAHGSSNGTSSFCIR